MLTHVAMYIDPTCDHDWKAMGFSNRESAESAAQMLYKAACDHDYGEIDDAGFLKAVSVAERSETFVSHLPVSANMVISLA